MRMCISVNVDASFGYPLLARFGIYVVQLDLEALDDTR